MIVCAQDAFNIPACVRRCANFWVLWRCPDMDAMATIARRTGMNKNQFQNLFDRFITNFHDSLWIDMTAGSKYKIRKNGFKVIRKKDK
jgi:hypothetical protein